MYKIDDYIMSDTFGICQVLDVQNLEFSKSTGYKDYYIIKPIARKDTTFFLSVDGENASTRPVMTKTEANRLFAEIPDIINNYIDYRPVSDERFDEAAMDSDLAQYIRMLQNQYHQYAERVTKNNTLSDRNEKILKASKQRIFDEFAFALGVPPEDSVEAVKTAVKKYL